MGFVKNFVLVILLVTTIFLFKAFPGNYIKQENLDVKKRLDEDSVYTVNSERIKKVEDYCKVENRSLEPTPLAMNAEMWCRFYDCPIYYTQKYNFSLCFLHKIASTTFQSHLVQLFGMNGLSKAETQWHGHRLRRYSTAYMAQPPFVGHFKFLFVRHPFRRLVSAYYAKLVIECNDPDKPKRGPICPIGHQIKLAYRGEDDDKYDPVTFKELVRYIIDTADQEFDSHWSRIHKVCDPCSVHYDFIGKVETADTDMPYVYKRLGLLDMLGDVSKVINHSGSEDKFYECFSKLTMEEFDKLSAVYKKDFDLFDYSPEEFRKYLTNDANLS